AKIEHDQKVKGLLNVFGIYDYTNDRMLTHCYQQKKSNQFIDFIERVDSSYDLNIKRIFLVLDNASIHKSKKTKESLSKHHPRITLVFLPTKSPKFNVIEVRWMWLQRKAMIIVRSEINQILDKQYRNGLRITMLLMGEG